MVRKLNIVLDTNALISILSRKLNFQDVLLALKNGKFNLFITNEILLEYEELIKQFYDNSQFDRVLFLFELLPNVHKIQVYFNMNLIINDNSDNKFVDCAFCCNADYIVTNDKHFNILKTIEHPKIKVLSIEEFAKVLKMV